MTTKGEKNPDMTPCHFKFFLPFIYPIILSESYRISYFMLTFYYLFFYRIKSAFLCPF